ncbi:GNAT family N-acetyltransferase [Loktanella sp. SALINAS62]|uniref:GNAT family N-acetyltransferase n=1 Tax=Loktanella sp. SALINAS62 TaxID=2706124 RepID=UPI001B8BB660|nr:GNAT family N-acetyltransferase [Loktanella sp. SALINAS62]MBS1301528.1 GNAT family N-acetyltransferase [Loktanella sp. SALINAS62]
MKLRFDAAQMQTPHPYRLKITDVEPDIAILTRTSWSVATPFDLMTSRLRMRPLTSDDETAFHKIAGQRSIARMLVNLEHPLSFDAAVKWQRQRRFTGRLGFMVGIFDRQNTLIGAIGLGGLSTALVYFLAESARGKGYGTEAVRAFLEYTQARFALTKTFAGVFTDNPGSRKILEGCGFQVLTTSTFQSPARDTPDAIWEMEWHRKGFEPI